MKIGTLELVVIFIVALLVIGPNKLPEYARKFGQAMKEFKKASQSITNDIKENIVEPLDEVQKPIKEAVAPITEMEKEIRSNLQDVTNSVNNIGKPQKTAPQAETAKAEAPKAEASKVETPQAETPKAEAPAPEPRAEESVQTAVTQAEESSEKETTL